MSDFENFLLTGRKVIIITRYLCNLPVTSQRLYPPSSQTLNIITHIQKLTPWAATVRSETLRSRPSHGAFTGGCTPHTTIVRLSCGLRLDGYQACTSPTIAASRCVLTTVYF